MNWHPDIPEEYRNHVVTGDARELAKRLPEESVDLIFTDPVYDRIEDYRWLAETAARVLTPDSACLVWLTNGRIPIVLDLFAPHLRYVKVLCFHMIRMIAGRPAYRRDSRSFVQWTPLLWFEKGTHEASGRMPDLAWANWGNGEQNHGWHKALVPLARWVECCSAEGAVVFDPFTGSGTVPAVCKQLRRNYVAFEIDPGTATLARERIRLTPEPLILPDPVEWQGELAF